MTDDPSWMSSIAASMLGKILFIAHHQQWKVRIANRCFLEKAAFRIEDYFLVE